MMNDVSPIAGIELGAWVRRYDECGINRDFPPPDALRRLAAVAGCVVSSDVLRSVESAAWLSERVARDPLLREAGLPDRISIPIRLQPGACVALARVAWWLNWNKSVETVADARARARHATHRLSELAREHGSVLVIGHGMFNRFIAKCLRENGWSGPRTLPHAHWSIARFIQNP
jgi:broad specificity phosphatase PhoE